jgi:hypothetical protein
MALSSVMFQNPMQGFPLLGNAPGFSGFTIPQAQPFVFGQGPLNPMLGLFNPTQGIMMPPSVGGGFNSVSYMGYVQQKSQGTQNAFEALRRRLESDSKSAASKAETQASLGDATGIFSPLNTYDHSAVGAWDQGGQGYVSQPGLDMLF